MTKRSMTHTPEEFLERLARNELGPPLVLTGIVKKREGDDKQLMFSVGMSCTQWRAVPIDLIESIEVLDFLPCRDHSHPLAKLYFKTPSSPETMLFAALLCDTVRVARDLVIKVLAKVQNGGATARSDCAQCIRDCGVQSPEEFFVCLNRCAALCPSVVENE